VTLAQSVSVQTQDRAEFVRLLEHALTFDPDRDPRQRLATIVLQRKAKALLARQDEFFLDDVSPTEADTTTTQENR
jgi:TRAP transporter T-component